jgi:hypothetical protein
MGKSIWYCQDGGVKQHFQLSSLLSSPHNHFPIFRPSYLFSFRTYFACQHSQEPVSSILHITNKTSAFSSSLPTARLYKSWTFIDMAFSNQFEEQAYIPSDFTTISTTSSPFEDVVGNDGEFSFHASALFGGELDLNLDPNPLDHAFQAPVALPEAPEVNAMIAAHPEILDAAAPPVIPSTGCTNDFQHRIPETPHHTESECLSQISPVDLAIYEYIAKHDEENNRQANPYTTPAIYYANHTQAVPSEAPETPENNAELFGSPEAASTAPLQFSSWAEAKEACASRQKPQLLEQGDDYEDVEKDSASNVRRIITAFEGDWIPRPAIAISEEERVDWARFQQGHAEKAAMAAEAEPFGIEPFAWFLLETVLQMHKKGGTKKTRYSCDRFRKCSDRLDAIIRAISDYAIIRCDVLGENFDALVASPKSAIARKTSNWRGNERKAIRDRENLAAAKAANFSGLKSVLGCKKRKLTSTESNPASNSDSQTTSGKKRRSRATGFSPASGPTYVA